MPAPTTLAECLDEYAPSAACPGSIADRAVRRAFMAGSLEALQLLKRGATPERLLAECVQFGRAVGTAVERAPLTFPPTPKKGAA